MKKHLITYSLVCLGAAALAQSDRIPSGTDVMVRTSENIEADAPSDYRIYRGTVDREVPDASGRTVIPRGADAELILRKVSGDMMTLDLESITVNGRRYVVNSTSEGVSAERDQKDSVGANKRTGKYVGGGAIIGSIIGAIAGGGKGAAIGAATGAAAGAVGQTVTRGNRVRVPAETVLTFRLDRPLVIGREDEGYMKDGRHYHRYDETEKFR
jgi:outer membrane lipoprotein SlyB